MAAGSPADPSIDLAPSPRLSPVPHHVGALASVREFSRPQRLAEYQARIKARPGVEKAMREEGLIKS